MNWEDEDGQLEFRREIPPDNEMADHPYARYVNRHDELTVKINIEHSGEAIPFARAEVSGREKLTIAECMSGNPACAIGKAVQILLFEKADVDREHHTKWGNHNLACEFCEQNHRDRLYRKGLWEDEA